MTARVKGSFIEYLDFLDILIETYKIAPKELFEKMIQISLSAFHNQKIEIEREALEIDEMSVVPVDDLEEYYDIMIDKIDELKLLKKRLIKLKESEPLFQTLYGGINSLYKALVLHMDRMGQLEVKLLQKKQSV